MMSDNTSSEEQPGLRDQVGVVLRSARASALHATQHLEALADLLQEELAEYGRKQARRLVQLLVGGLLLGCAYLLLCVLAVMLLHPLVQSYPIAIALVLVFNLAAGLVMLLIGKRCKPDGVAPHTMRELKTDLEWIERSLKGKE